MPCCAHGIGDYTSSIFTPSCTSNSASPWLNTWYWLPAMVTVPVCCVQPLTASPSGRMSLSCTLSASTSAPQLRPEEPVYLSIKELHW